jgi:hypothetical protein
MNTKNPVILSDARRTLSKSKDPMHLLAHHPLHEIFSEHRPDLHLYIRRAAHFFRSSELKSSYGDSVPTA